MKQYYISRTGGEIRFSYTPSSTVSWAVTSETPTSGWFNWSANDGVLSISCLEAVGTDSKSIELAYTIDGDECRSIIVTQSGIDTPCTCDNVTLTCSLPTTEIGEGTRRITDKIPSEGATVIFTYDNTNCINGNVSFEKKYNQSDTIWSISHNQTAMTLVATINDIGTRLETSDSLVYKLNGNVCEEIGFVQRTWCSHLTKFATTLSSSIPQSGMTSGTTIGEWELDSSVYDDKIFVYSQDVQVTYANGMIRLGETISPNTSAQRSFTINAYMTGDTTPCSSFTIVQEGLSDCGCEDLSIRLLDPSVLTYRASSQIPPSTQGGGGHWYGGMRQDSSVYGATILSHTFNDGVGTVIFSNDVESIGTEAFSICSEITNIDIPYNATSIGDYAFNRCNNLTSIYVPNYVTSIGVNAFSQCASLTSCTIGSGVRSIGSSAFYQCSGLTSIEIPNEVAAIEEYTFYGCTSLISCLFEQGYLVESIGGNAFYGCSGLTSIVIPNTVTRIGEGAFASCSGLINCTLGGSVTSIGDGAFYYCSSLTNIDIPDTVTRIGDSAFGGCSSLTSVTVNSNNTVYDSRNGCNAIIETDTNTLILGCSGTLIPSSVTSIGNSAFFGCSGLTSISIPNSVTSIGEGAFSFCEGLTVCTIGSGIESIGDYAFEDCSGLTSITIEATTPPTLVNNSFYNTNNCPIYVPNGSVETYKGTSGWSTYESRIQAIP